MKQAIYLVLDHGIDGRGPERIVFASEDEKKRDTWFNQSPNKNWYMCADRVIDLHEVAIKTWKKLDGLERLSFLSPDCPILPWKKDSNKQEK